MLRRILHLRLTRWSLACVVLFALPADAQKKLPGFGPEREDSRLVGFGKNAKRLIIVIESDRTNAKTNMGKYDRDKDGKLDSSELTTSWLRSLMPKYDLNENRVIELDELSLGWADWRLGQEKKAKEKAAKAKAVVQNREKKEIKIPDRPISQAMRQRMQMCAGLASELIGIHDRNRNKQLEQSEWPQSGTEFGRVGASADANDDRVITAAELSTWLQRRLPPLATSRLAKPLQLLDTDRDGQISMNEFAFRWTDAKSKDFQSLDHNDDGVISPEESHGAPVPRGAVAFHGAGSEVVNASSDTVSRIEIDDDLVIDDLDLRLGLTKPNETKMQIQLIGPDDQTITIYKGEWKPWSTGYVFENTLIDDQAGEIESTLSEMPIPRRLRPDGLKDDEPAGLSAFDGKSARGEWRLVIKNTDKNVGVLHHWSIWIKPSKNN